jgi:hypothetical protein
MERASLNRMKVNKWGLLSVAFVGAAFLVPWRYPLCFFHVFLNLSALVCSVVAVKRGSKYWVVVSALSLVFCAQAVLALFVEC